MFNTFLHHQALARLRASSGADTWTANNATLSAQDDYLVAYWKAEDLTDEINSHTLTNNGTVTFTAGKHNDAFTLNGSSQYLSAAYSTDFAFGSGDFTLTCWAKPNTISSQDVFMSQHDGASVAGSNWQFYWDASGNVAGTIYDTSDNSYSPTGPSTISAGTYYLLTMTRVGTNVTVYVNDTAGTPVSIGANTVDTNAIATLIGAQTTSAQHTYGQLDQIAIWKGYGATSAFVTALYNSGTGAFRE